MKKFISKVSMIAVVSSVAFGASAYAKTEGAFVGLNIIKADVRHDLVNNLTNSASVNTSYPHNGSNAGAKLGVEAKYAIPVANNFFIAPGVFYEKLGTEAINNADNTAISRTRIDNRYGAKLDIGYDLNDSVAAYFTNGIAHVSIKQDTETLITAGTPASLREGANSYFYGFGLMGHINENVSIGAEYNTQTATVMSVDSQNNTSTTTISQKLRSRIDVYKLNIAYRF